MSKVKILAFAGSARKDSCNKKLIRFAVDQIKETAEVTLIDLADFAMPIYDGDLEETEGAPENAKRLRQLFVDHDGLLLACPEYNSSITPLLKNVIDWVSRPVEGQIPLVAFQGKVAALLSASPGQLGGIRGLVHVRSILGNIGVIVIPQQVAVGGAYDKLEGGTLNDDRLAASVTSACQSLVELTSKIHGN